MTDYQGKLYEHVEYFPFGETWVQEALNTDITPYLFTSKILDTETGLYYFGARYYDPRTSVWQSPDPALGRYLSSRRGSQIYRSANLGVYSYVFNNPLNALDPDGREGIVISGQPGRTHVVKTHFLTNGLSRAQAMRQQGGNVTWFIYNGRSSGYSQADIASFTRTARDAGINVRVTGNANEIVDYINIKSGGSSRADDLITHFTYVGHGTPGDLEIGYVDKSMWSWLTAPTLDVGGLDAGAFASGCAVNLAATCQSAVQGDEPFESSVMEQFQRLVDSQSNVKGSEGRIDFHTPAVDTDQQLIGRGRQADSITPTRLIEDKGNRK